MKLSTILKSMTLGVGVCIFAVGLVLAQTPPEEKTTRRQAREACEAGLKPELKDDERRGAMRECMAQKRGEMREARRESRKAEGSRRRETVRACREEVKDQRLTEDERRAAIEDCAGKKDPHFARLAACRKEAEEKKLARGDSAFRSHMRTCMTRG